MRRSIAIIQPSLFEGWSTVVVEGRCLGKTMILSDIDTHIEQSPPNCKYFNKNSVTNLAYKIEQVWNSSKPGPNIKSDKVARLKNKQEVKDFGFRLLELFKLNYLVI